MVTLNQDPNERRANWRRRFSRRHLALIVAGLATTAVAGVAIASVSGDDPPEGAKIAPGQTVGSATNKFGGTETVMATGDSAFGAWRLASYQSEGLQDGSTELEKKGSPCLRLILNDPPPGSPAGVGLCFTDQDAGKTLVSALPVRSSATPQNILFGRAPSPATAVEIRDGSGKVQRVALHSAPAGFGGDLFAVVLPATLDSAVLQATTGDASRSRPVGESRPLADVIP